MLYAKINPVAKAYKRINPFSETTIDCDYMTALARPYEAGSSKTKFEIVFGTVTFDNNTPIEFNRLIDYNITLSSSEISTWGMDDTVLLTIIASKLGITAIDFITIDDNRQF